MRPLVLVVVLACAGCGTLHAPTLSRSPPAVSFIPQQANHCGPAALAMLANYHGHPVTPDEIAAAIYLPEIHGTLTAELADYARRFQLFVRQYPGSPADLRRKLAAGLPLIVLGRLGDRWHYFVVLRDGDPLVVHTDTRPYHRVRREDFLRWWDKAGRWTLLVCPPARLTGPLTAAEHNDLGVYYEKTVGDLPLAEAQYQQATSQQPANAYYQLNLGNALRDQGKLREAEAVFARAPANADALNNRADVLATLGERLDEAAALCLRACELLPAHRAWYLDTLGSIRLKQGNKHEAVRAFEQALAATTDRQSTLRAGIQRRLAAARALAEE